MIETILVAAVLAAIVAAIIGKGIYNRARRKGGGCGGCFGCGGDRSRQRKKDGNQVGE